MPKKLYCDVCGSTVDANEDYEGNVFCSLHRAEYDLRMAIDEYKERRDWVERVWLDGLKKKEKEIERLKKLVANLREDER